MGVTSTPFALQHGDDGLRGTFALNVVIASEAAALAPEEHVNAHMVGPFPRMGDGATEPASLRLAHPVLPGLCSEGWLSPSVGGIGLLGASRGGSLGRRRRPVSAFASLATAARRATRSESALVVVGVPSGQSQTQSPTPPQTSQRNSRPSRIICSVSQVTGLAPSGGSAAICDACRARPHPRRSPRTR